MNKFLSLLGLARRAGKIAHGFDAATLAIKNDTAFLAVVSCEMSDKTKKNVAFETTKKNVPLLIIQSSIEDISKSIGKKAGVVAIINKDFANGLIKEAENQGISLEQKG